MEMKERRKSYRLDAEDIDLIVLGIRDSLDKHFCRFSSITTKDMETAVPFMLGFKGVVEKTGMWVWKIIIGIIVSGIIGLTALGFWSNFKE